MTFLIDGTDGCPGRRRVAAAVAGITLAFAAAAAAAPAPNQWSRKVSACLRDACILTAAIDSDGDGVADVDEVAAGTDPYDARSRPGGRLLLEMARARKLPSYAKGFTTIVVLPTTAPDGSALFGGEFALPGRKSTLEKLGITSELLKGIDLTKGVSMEVSDRELVLSSLGFARVSKGDSPSQTIPGTFSDLFGFSPNQGSSVNSTSVNGSAHAGTSQVNHSDGSKDFFGWQTDEKGTKLHANYENKDGHQTGSGSYTQTSTTDADGVTTTTSHTEVHTNSGSFEQTTTTATNTDGSSYTSTQTNQTTSDGQGNSTHTSSSSTTSTNADGEQETHSSTVTETCNSKNECSTTVTDSGGGTTVTDGGGTGCTDADCEGESDTAYRDPDYMEVTPSAEAVATALIVLNSRLDYYHDPMNDTSEPITLPPPDPEDVSPYILVTGDYEEPAIVDADFFYMGGVQPDYDPTLEMPVYEDPRDPKECWECRNP